MADAHGDTDLRRLEREAETARARLHETIAEIKDPRTIENAKLEMKHRAEEMKDQIVGYIKGAKDNALESGRAQGNEFTRKLQRTAIENPLSVALIGAGIGWHLYKKPPITTALIGAGIWQMMKGWDNTPDDSAYRDPYNRLAPRGYVPGGVAGYGYDEVTDIASATERVKTVATNLSYGAQDAVAGVQDAVSSATERVREAMGAGVDQTRATTAHAADDMSRLGVSMAERASEQYQGAASRMQDLAQDAQDRAQGMMEDATDTMRGMAGEAQRRIQPMIDRVSPYIDEHRSQLGMVMVLGGVGALAGAWLRSSETGRRWMDDARDRLGDTWDDLRERSQFSGEDWRDSAASAASSTMSRASEQMSSLRRSAMDNASDLRERSAATMRSAQELGSEHPLLLSAIGLAIGAVLGGMIRPTAFESETFGAMAQDLRDSAADALQTGMEGMAERASQVTTAVVGAVTGDSDDPAKKAQAQRDRINA